MSSRVLEITLDSPAPGEPKAFVRDRDKPEGGLLPLEAWSEPQELDGALPDVETLDADLLPDSLRPLVEDTAERMQVPIDFPGVTTMSAIGMGTARRALIQPKVYDSSWGVVAHPWGGMVGPPGVMKSPVISAIFAPLRKIEEEWCREYEVASLAYDEALETGKLDLAVFKEQYKSARKKGTDIPERFDSTTGLRPIEQRITTTDPTIEKLHLLAKDNPAGVGMVRDELVGFLAGLDRPGHESDRAFYLEGWNGDQPYTIDRIGRGSVRVDHLCVTIYGGIQPGRLRAYLGDVLRDGPSNDGLIQRFQMLIWPDIKPGWVYTDTRPNASALKAAEEVYRRITAMDPNAPQRFRFDDEGQELFEAWLTRLEMRLRNEDMSPIMQAHLAKYRSLMPSIALLLSLADGATSVVDFRHAQQAADWCEYLESHARRIYASHATPEKLAAISLSKKIRGMLNEGKHTIALRDIYRHEWYGLGTPEEARAALQVLNAAGWVVQERQEPKAGRPSESYRINPRIVRSK
jgi:putative DNA primase/helicase